MQLVSVSKAFEHRIVPGWFEKFHGLPEERIEPGRGMQHVKVERKQSAAEMQLRTVIQRAAPVALETLRERPADDVAQRVEIKMEVERHPVIEPEVVVIDGAVVHWRDAEGDGLSILPPDKKPGPFRHALTQAAQVLFGQALELQRRALMHLQIERINLVDVWR